MRAFLAGLGIGAAVGILLAPRPGKQTRSALADRINDGWDRWQEQKQKQQRRRPSRKTESANDEAQADEALTEVLNTVSKHELMTVPGIGKGTAKKIVEHRPYESKEEILQEGVLREEILERVEERLIEKKTDVAS